VSPRLCAQTQSESGASSVTHNLEPLCDSHCIFFWQPHLICTLPLRLLGGAASQPIRHTHTLCPHAHSTRRSTV
jgi:hypothetical protein